MTKGVNEQKANSNQLTLNNELHVSIAKEKVRKNLVASSMDYK